jgi:archaellum component FlaF (FlaF/FlaG flagellin family)
MRFIKRFLTCKRALSTVISTIIMINIAFVTGILVYAWGQGVLGSWTAESGIYFEIQGEAMREKILLVNLRYSQSAYYQLNMTVRNVGYIEARVADIFLNDTKVLSQVSLVWKNDGTLVSAKSGKYLIPVGDAVTFAFTSITPPPTLVSAKLMRVVVATDRGTRAYEEWSVIG